MEFEFTFSSNPDFLNFSKRTGDSYNLMLLRVIKPGSESAGKVRFIHLGQERALRITYKDAESTYSEILEKDCAATIHTKNLQLLMTEMYKTKNGLNPSFMREIFCENATHYNLRNNDEFVQPRGKSVSNGT